MKRRGENGMGRISLEVDIANQEDVVLATAGAIPRERIRRVRVPAVVDTGASFLVIPKHVATQLGVAKRGKATIRYADRRKATRDIVRNLEVNLLGRASTFDAIVEPKRDSVLIGAIVLEGLDLLVDCRAQKLLPRDPRHISAEME